MRPLLGIGLTLDYYVTVGLLIINLVFALAFAVVSFRGRPIVDRALLTLGILVVLMVGSFVGLHLFARTPIRDAQVFVVD